jgi:hypothetical protein
VNSSRLPVPCSQNRRFAGSIRRARWDALEIFRGTITANVRRCRRRIKNAHFPRKTEPQVALGNPLQNRLNTPTGPSSRESVRCIMSASPRLLATSRRRTSAIVGWPGVPQPCAWISRPLLRRHAESPGEPRCGRQQTAGADRGRRPSSQVRSPSWQRPG